MQIKLEQDLNIFLRDYEYNPLHEASKHGFSVFTQVMQKLDSVKSLHTFLKLRLPKGGLVRQNILDIVMNDIDKFKACCNELIKTPEDFASLLTEPCETGDTVLHQLMMYGRLDAYKHLLSIAKYNKTISDALDTAMQLKNNKNYTPKDIMELSDDNLTIFLAPYTDSTQIKETVERVNTMKQQINLPPKAYNIKYQVIFDELNLLQADIKKTTNNIFKNQAEILHGVLSEKFTSLLQDDNLNIFYKNCQQEINQKIPNLNQELTGFFMRWLNKIANIFGFRKEEKQQDELKQHISNKFQLFFVLKNKGVHDNYVINYKHDIK